MHNNVIYDVSNAFYTIDRNKLDQWVEQVDQGLERMATKQVVENATAIVEGTDGTTILSLGSGVPPGLSSATNMFN